MTNRNLRKPTLTALRGEGYDSVATMDSLSGIKALEQAKHIELLITRVRFPSGTPNGAAAQATGCQGSVRCVPRGSGLYRGPREFLYRDHYPLTNCWRRAAASYSFSPQPADFDFRCQGTNTAVQSDVRYDRVSTDKEREVAAALSSREYSAGDTFRAASSAPGGQSSPRRQEQHHYR
jgi:hypothetical protein